MSKLRLDNVSLYYGRPTTSVAVLDRISLDIASGDFVAVLGHSGSGKTSLLNVAAGFIAPTTGRVTIDGAARTGPSAERAVVFQDDALFAWLNVRNNIALPLQLKGLAPEARHRRADQLLEQVGLKGEGSRSIWTLSGGQRQRVGLARALAAEPQFLLMDEPLGALDAMTRDRMQELLLRVWQASRTGALMITHSVEEALFLATRVVVLYPAPGRIGDVVDVGYGARFLQGESARTIKSDPRFIADRERLIEAIHFSGERAAA
jgi:taurine transport system ATP-binding protein